MAIKIRFGTPDDAEIIYRFITELAAYEREPDAVEVTPEILRRLEAGAGGALRVLTVKALREGWFGKNNAMRAGVEAASGDWLCFTDADCRQISTRTLSVAMGEALAHHVDFLCVTPVLETKTVWEKIIQPVCALVLIVWFLPGRVNDPAKKTAYANGAFMLLRRECYDAIGGHYRVCTQVNEDVHLARLAKQSGQCLRVVENEDLYRTRMYRTPGEAWRGWSRIFCGCLETWPRLVASAGLVTMLTILPWVSLVVALIGRSLVEPEAVWSWSLAVYAWAGVILLKQAVLWRVYPVLRVERPWSFTYVAGAMFGLAMLISAILKVTGATGITGGDVLTAAIGWQMTRTTSQTAMRRWSKGWPTTGRYLGAAPLIGASMHLAAGSVSGCPLVTVDYLPFRQPRSKYQTR